MNLNLYVVKHKVLEAIVWWISTHTGSITGCLGCRVIWLSSPTAPHLSESKESGQGWQQFPGRNSGIGEEQREQASPSSVVQVYCQGGSIDCLVPTYCHLSKLASFQDSELGGQRQCSVMTCCFSGSLPHCILNILMCRQDGVFPTHHQRISWACVSLHLPSVTDQLMNLACHRIGGA